jgi:Protein tyrosine and serine/threonine kinase
MVDGVGIASLAAATPGLIDLCIQYGRFLAGQIDLYKNMGDIVRLQDFVSRLVEGELYEILTFFASVNDSLSDPFKSELQILFQTLRDKLEQVKGAFPEKAGGSLAKLEFSFYYAKKIKNACAELEQWQTRFIRRALVYLYFGGPSTAANPPHTIGSRAFERIESIRNGFENSPADTPILVENVDDSDYDKLPDSSLLNMKDEVGTQRLLEYRNYSDDLDKETVNSIGRTVRDLAASLQKADPSTMGILGCCGFSADPLSNRFALHFPYPMRKRNPRSLLNLLTDPRNKERGLVHPINDRINLARKIASAVLYVHSCDFVHKNIRPSNIIIFEPESDQRLSSTEARLAQYPYSIGEPYLVGFEGVRKAEAGSQRLGVAGWERNIYLPPERHRLAKGDDFTMQHDVYSLGVVLLEIAIWSAFTDRKGIGQRLWEPGQGGILAPEALQNEYIRIANSQIPRLLGKRYRDAVVACLTGLKDEEKGHLLDDKDGFVVGLAYITQVMRKIEDISV